MSLRSFHLAFVTLAALLAFGFSFWAWVEKGRTGGDFSPAWSLLAAASGAALVGYGLWIRRKLPMEPS